MRKQLVLLAALLLSFTTAVYGVMFSFELAGALLVGILLSFMTVSFNVLEFSTAYYARIFFVERRLLAAIVSLFFILSGVLFSVTANSWVIAGKHSDYEKSKAMGTHEYESWRIRVESLEQKISDVQSLGLSRDGLEASIYDAKSKMESLLNQRAYNSNNRYSGQAVGQITNNCVGDGYYFDKYCADYQKLADSLDESMASLETLNKLPVLQNTLAGLYDDPPENKGGGSAGIQSISMVLNVDSDYLSSFLHVFIALFNELGAIFAWFLVSIPEKRFSGRVSEYDGSYVRLVKPKHRLKGGDYFDADTVPDDEVNNGSLLPLSINVKKKGVKKK
jgi:hypothetical protein